MTVQPAERIARIREIASVLDRPICELSFIWIDLGILSGPKFWTFPPHMRHNLPLARRWIAQQDWKERKRRKRRVSPRTRRIVFARAGGQCEYCGNAATEVDHIVPVALGGRSYLRNLAAACAICNKEKFDMRLDDWLAVR